MAWLIRWWRGRWDACSAMLETSLLGCSNKSIIVRYYASGLARKFLDGSLWDDASSAAFLYKVTWRYPGKLLAARPSWLPHSAGTGCWRNHHAEHWRKLTHCMQKEKSFTPPVSLQHPLLTRLNWCQVAKKKIFTWPSLLSQRRQRMDLELRGHKLIKCSASQFIFMWRKSSNNKTWQNLHKKITDKYSSWT